MKCQNNRDSAWRKNSKFVWQFCIPQLSIPSDKDSNWNVKTDFALMRNVGQLTWENVLPILLKVDQCGHTDASQFERMLFSFFLKKWPTPASFSFIFGHFKQTLQFLQQINVKNVHLVYGTGYRTHDLWIVSVFP